jgi:hypothetical protein
MAPLRVLSSITYVSCFGVPGAVFNCEEFYIAVRLTWHSELGLRELFAAIEVKVGHH